MDRPRRVAVSTSNLVWLAAIVVVGLVVGLWFGPVPGLVAAGLVLLSSEVVERARRHRRRSPR